MSEATMVSAPRTKCQPQRPGVAVPFDTISSAGAYVCDWSGHLLRVPVRSIPPGQSLKLNIIGSAPLTVTKISDDPDVPLTEARTLAVSLGARPGF